MLITFFVNILIFNILNLLKKVNQQKLWVTLGILQQVAGWVTPRAIKRITLGVPPLRGGMVVKGEQGVNGVNGEEGGKMGARGEWG
ncbi:MAG: hypothetical protein IKZ52_04060 [Bacteroidales bacterium]|nr:hypothetical protein [Bacteroidales bacterium]